METKHHPEIFFCRTCGGSLVLENGKWVCKYCGNEYEDVKVRENSDLLKEFIDKIKIEQVSNLRRNLYDALHEKKRVVIPGTVYSINEYAFNYCTSLSEVIICEGVISIRRSAFSGCRAISKLNIPASVKEIEDNPFEGVPCKKINISKNNLVYEKIDNCIIDKKNEILIAGDHTSVIPRNIVSIESFAFAYCEDLFNIIIPDNIEHIGDFAFSGCEFLEGAVISRRVKTLNCGVFHNCSKLSMVTIPNSVTEISGDTFERCLSLTTIIYNGKKKEWKAIKKNLNWDKKDWKHDTGRFTVQCLDGKIGKILA